MSQDKPANMDPDNQSPADHGHDTSHPVSITDSDSNPHPNESDPVLGNKTVKGLDQKARRLILQSELGLLANVSTYKEAFLGHIDQTNLNGCVRLFTRNNPTIFCFSTWTQQEQDARSGLPVSKEELEALNKAMMQPGGTMNAIIWPFFFTNHFVLCVIRPDRTATVYDSMGNGQKYLRRIQDRMPDQLAEWRMKVGVSPLQNNPSDCGIYCIAIAAFLASGRDAPSSINAKFWRLACFSAAGLADTGEALADSKFFSALDEGGWEDVLAGERHLEESIEGVKVLADLAYKTCRLTRLAEEWGRLRESLSERVEVYELQAQWTRPATEQTKKALADEVLGVVSEIDAYEERWKLFRRDLIVSTERQARLCATHVRMSTLLDIVRDT